MKVQENVAEKLNKDIETNYEPISIVPFSVLVKPEDYQVPMDLFLREVALNHHEFPITKSIKHQKWLLNPLSLIDLIPQKEKLFAFAHKLYHEQAIRSLTLWQTIRNFFITISYNFAPFPLPKQKIDFVFLIHTRYVADYKSVFPFLNILRGFSMNLYVNLIQKFPPCIIDHFNADNGLRGLLISTPQLPDTLMRERKRTEKEIQRVKKLLTKYCAPNPRKIVLGLGGWWPMVSKKGELFKSYFTPKDGYRITTGHTATVYSLVTSTMQLINKSQIDRSKFNVAILGCGNIGSHCAEFLLDLGVQVTLIDVNLKKLRHLRHVFLQQFQSDRIHTAIFTTKRIKRILKSCHMGICATSNVGSIISVQQIPKHFIFIDDSRPEAIPRFSLQDKRYTLEGGLLSIHGLHSSFDFGFGNDHNTLGCLSESFLLAWDRIDTQMVNETVGKIDQNNFRLFSAFCALKGITPGSYKIGDLVVSEDHLLHAIQKRHLKMNLSI